MESGYSILPEAGCVRIAGEDRRSFLQRQTTNHIDLLRPERSLLSVLTSPTGRILDVLILLAEPLDAPDAILALTLPGRGASSARYLRSRIFFMDKVSVADESPAFAQLEVFGPAAAEALAALGLAALPEANAATPGEHGVRGVRLEPGFGPGYRLLVPVDALAQVESRLAGAALPARAPQDYARLRLEAGLPWTAEWNEDYTPLETGLRAAVSENKGCYTGQEVIARQITYDKITRGVCGLRLSAPAIAPADLFTLDGAPAGRLTSALDSPTLGPVGLAIVRRPHDAPGTRLRVGETARGVTAEVAALPLNR